MTQPKFVVEASWEVANKVGGIYTVVRTKAKYLVEQYQNYLLIGPLFPQRRDIEFNEQPPPERIRHVLDSLRDQGIHGVYGTWNIEGKPNAVLLSAQEAHINTNEIKGKLWETFGVDTLHSAWDYEEPLRWSWAVGMFIDRLQATTETRIVAHLHEWLAGIALLYLKMHNSRVGTVFTTHATMLGRTICGATDWDLYEVLQEVESLKTAKELGVIDKHTTEVACAKAADTFTTVSDITAKEAQYLLGKDPDVILYNGIATSQIKDADNAIMQHRLSRENIRDFLDYFFFSHYEFDLGNTLIFFTSGRYEFSNKGFDIIIDALAKLNSHLKAINYPGTIVMFFFVPQDTQGIKTELLEEKAAFDKLHEYVRKQSDGIVRTLIRNAHSVSELSCEMLLDQDAKATIRRLADSMRHGGNPPLCTHNLPREDSDAIISTLKSNNLFNKQEDRVKVVSYPIYLTGSDGLLNLSYDKVIAGTHLGIFPSFYEPWGYTPVETSAMGIPSITSDLAGFGRYVRDLPDESPDASGVFVLKREGTKKPQAVDELFHILKAFVALDQEGRRKEKEAATQISRKVTWDTFIKRYYQAYERAYES